MKTEQVREAWQNLWNMGVEICERDGLDLGVQRGMWPTVAEVAHRLRIRGVNGNASVNYHLNKLETQHVVRRVWGGQAGYLYVPADFFNERRRAAA